MFFACGSARAAAEPFFDHLATFIKAGALGFAMLGMILAYRLLSGTKVREGLVFLGIVLAASFVFLYAEHSGVSIVRFPRTALDGEPILSILRNDTPLKFDKGVEHLACASATDITVDAEPLLVAYRQAKSDALAARAQPHNAAEKAAVGLDTDAGAP